MRTSHNRTSATASSRSIRSTSFAPSPARRSGRAARQTLPKDGIAPLDGIVETDWLTFTFTMNWVFTRPGRVTFEKDEPFCFITPVGYHALDGVVPEIVPIGANPKLQNSFDDYGKRRLDFNAKLAANDPETLRKGWQKWYLRGEQPSGEIGNPAHIPKLRLAAPRFVEVGQESTTGVAEKKPRRAKSKAGRRAPPRRSP